MLYKEWLDSLSVGNQVIVHEKFKGFSLDTVKKIRDNRLYLTNRDDQSFQRNGRLTVEKNVLKPSVRLLPPSETLISKAIEFPKFNRSVNQGELVRSILF